MVPQKERVLTLHYVIELPLYNSRAEDKLSLCWIFFLNSLNFFPLQSNVLSLMVINRSNCQTTGSEKRSNINFSVVCLQ